MVWATYCGTHLAGVPEPARVQRTVGMLIRGLLIIQAALVCIAGWPMMLVAIALLLLWPVQGALARRFYSS